MPLFHERKRCQHLHSFTLTEVVLAIGVFALALTSIVGLFQTGLTTLRSSINSTTEGQLVQYIATTSSLSSFTNVACATTTGYFDEDGRYLSSASDPNVHYRVLTEPEVTSLPGTAAFSTNDAVCLRITIFQQAGPWGPTQGTSVYTIQVANSGK